MTDSVRIKVFIRTNKLGSKCEEVLEVNREEWESMTEEDREDLCRDQAFSMGEWGWEVVDD